METESRFLYGDGVETSSISTSASDQKSQKSPAGSIHTLAWKLLEGHLLSFLSFRLTLHPPSLLLQQRPETEKPETEILTLLFSSTFLPRGPQKLRRQKLSPTPDAPTFPFRPGSQKPRNRREDGASAPATRNDPSASSWRAAGHRPSWRGESAPLGRRCRVALLRSSRSRRRRRFRPARAGTWRLCHAGNMFACLDRLTASSSSR